MNTTDMGLTIAHFEDFDVLDSLDQNYDQLKREYDRLLIDYDQLCEKLEKQKLTGGDVNQLLINTKRLETKSEKLEKIKRAVRELRDSARYFSTWVDILPSDFIEIHKEYMNRLNDICKLLETN